MNSTGSSDYTLPVTADGYPVIIVAWAAVEFTIISIGIILRKAVFDYSTLRLSCVIMGLLVVTLGVANAFRITNDIGEDTYSITRDLNMAVFLDLMVAITFDLGSRFYVLTRVNILYHLAILTTVLVNVALVVGLVLQQIPATFSLGNSISVAMRVSWPVALFFAYWYAFYPVISTKLDSPSAVVAVGVWYLAGMGFFLLVHIITICAVIPFPTDTYKELSIIDGAISTFIRMALLDFYSFPPSKRVIILMRNKWFPHSMGGAIVPIRATTASDQFELHMSPGTKLKDEEDSDVGVGSKSEIVLVSKPEMVAVHMA
ncbi:hypothetical protein BC937DRAFT_86728 [Endogone sp. FLAS-F59071]|nr:hypothetical protein BC937DRAFT_86728 [Endogone sp. FLAS-F59071]|eukprot:RUS19907.1 hypothetical protein BC937DRAFT_86728 [Endogone sp. FLAS-F59071]